LIRQHSVHDLITAHVIPNYDEIQLFRSSPGFDLSVIRNWQIADSLAALRVGDRVQILTGELKGLRAIVNDIQDHILKVELLNLSGGLILELPPDHVCKAFLLGDFVQVRHGRDAGNRGYVVTTCESAEHWKSTVTFYRHDSPTETILPVSALFHSLHVSR
jgi:transcription elongation factor